MEIAGKIMIWKKDKAVRVIELQLCHLLHCLLMQILWLEVWHLVGPQRHDISYSSKSARMDYIILGEGKERKKYFSYL